MSQVLPDSNSPMEFFRVFGNTFYCCMSPMPLLVSLKPCDGYVGLINAIFLTYRQVRDKGWGNLSSMFIYAQQGTAVVLFEKSPAFAG